MSTIKGIAWPFSFHAGRVAVSEDEQHIRECVFQVVGIGVGEYIMKPDFGCGLQSRVFNPSNATSLVETDIREAVRKFEKRIRLTRVQVNQGSELGQLSVSMDYEIIELGTSGDATVTIGGQKS